MQHSTDGFRRRFQSLGLAVAVLVLAMPAWATQAAPQIDIPNAATPAPGVLTGGQPDREALEQAGETGYRTVVNLRTPGESPGWDEAAFVRELGLSYVSIPVAGVEGLGHENALRLAELLADEDRHPVMVHCGSGNRVGALMALAAFWVDGETAEDALKLGRSAGLSSLDGVVTDMLAEAESRRASAGHAGQSRGMGQGQGRGRGEGSLGPCAGDCGDAGGKCPGGCAGSGEGAKAGGSPAPLSSEAHQAVLEALADERRAEAVYAGVLERFGQVRPFSRVIEAERRHAAALVSLLDRRGLEVPRDEGEVEPTHYADLRAACAAAAQAEIENVAIYERWMEAEMPPDASRVFEHNRLASLERHLPAFERCLRGGALGKGRAAGRRGGGH